MDNVIQAAGRGNRNGESDIPVPVYVICIDGENLSNLPHIDKAKRAALALISEYNDDNGKFENELFGEKATGRYYEILDRDLLVNHTEYVTGPNSPTLYELLSDNSQYSGGEIIYYICQAFKTAGELFKVFEESQQSIIVAYDKESKDIVSELLSEKAKHDTIYLRRLLRKAQEYSVALFDNQLRILDDQNAITRICDDSILLLDERYYSDETGLILRPEKGDAE